MIRNCERCCKILTQREGVYDVEGKLFCNFHCMNSYEFYIRNLPRRKQK